MNILQCLYCMNYIFHQIQKEFCYNDKKMYDIESGNYYYEDDDSTDSRYVILSKTMYYCSIISFIVTYIFIAYVIYFIIYL